MDKFFYCENNVLKKVKMADLNIGEKAVFCGFDVGVDLITKRRLLEFGFIKNVVIIINNIAFLKDVFLVEVNGFMLAIRKDIATNIICGRIAWWIK